MGQDLLCRDILRELDVPDGVNIGLIDTVTRYALDHGHHVILEGILTAGTPVPARGLPQPEPFLLPRRPLRGNGTTTAIRNTRTHRNPQLPETHLNPANHLAG
ncbi:hypothetical protein [Nonomuraea sp. NPDC005650]|uniref:hypothetical protein n=1 Tax=Nonomuraea sp. NPDC005650 TaxID=3157045 RepID=UPI0033A0C50D